MAERVWRFVRSLTREDWFMIGAVLVALGLGLFVGILGVHRPQVAGEPVPWHPCSTTVFTELCDG